MLFISLHSQWPHLLFFIFPLLKNKKQTKKKKKKNHFFQNPRQWRIRVKRRQTARNFNQPYFGQVCFEYVTCRSVSKEIIFPFSSFLFCAVLDLCWASPGSVVAGCQMLVPPLGIEPALEGRFLTAGPPGKSQEIIFMTTWSHVCQEHAPSSCLPHYILLASVWTTAVLSFLGAFGI